MTSSTSHSKAVPKPVTRFDPAIPTLPRHPDGNLQISIVVVVYAMPEQAMNTLYSLSVDYQRGVKRDDYEIIVVENASDSLLGASRARSVNADVKYMLLDDGKRSPVPALNLGASHARGTHITFMIDGARMVTPGVINQMLAAISLSEHAVVAVPGYHLGAELQQDAVQRGYGIEQERDLLDSVNWPKDGYQLFKIAVLSGTSGGGIFKPIGESNCLCVPRAIVSELGGFDTGFVSIGGGQVNLDFYRRVVDHPDALLFILPGEGSFHQFHSGATTGSKDYDRDALMASYFAEYLSQRGAPFEPPSKRALYLGPIPDAALKFCRHGADAVIKLNNLE